MTVPNSSSSIDNSIDFITARSPCNRNKRLEVLRRSLALSLDSLFTHLVLSGFAWIISCSATEFHCVSELRLLLYSVITAILMFLVLGIEI